MRTGYVAYKIDGIFRNGDQVLPIDAAASSDRNLLVEHLGTFSDEPEVCKAAIGKNTRKESAISSKSTQDSPHGDAVMSVCYSVAEAQVRLASNPRALGSL